MDELLGAFVLSKLLENAGGGNAGMGRVANDLRLIHTASKVRIYEIADKIARNRARGDSKTGNYKPEVEIPEQDRWDFNLGDRVVIKVSLADFKSIQERTIGWKKSLRNVHPHIGIVTDFNSHYDNGIQLYFPEIFTSSAVYAGILGKTSKGAEFGKSETWKVGDFVKTDSDEKVIKILQRRLPDIPKRYYGKKGRVIAVTTAGVFVTYDGLRSYAINSALLQTIQDPAPIKVHRIGHPLGFEIGEKVQAIYNLKKMISNQKGKGGWSPDMCCLVGEKIIITDINDDDTIDVRFKSSKSWRLNHESVVELSKSIPREIRKDLDLKPKDNVKFKRIGNIRVILGTEDIPLEILELLAETAIIDCIDDDLDAVIRFNCDQKVAVDMSLLRKATDNETHKYDMRQERIKALKAGDVVMLDVGPPEYVKEVLGEIGAKSEIISALTTCAVVVGFTEKNYALLEYEDGKRYKIAKKFLTVPKM